MSEAQTIRRRYQKPPVVEALCELFFEGSEWNENVVNHFYDQVKNRFPKRRQMDVEQAQVTLSIKGQSSVGLQRMPPQLQFVSEKDDALLQLRQNLLVVNQLQPYPHFEAWEPNIYWALKIYSDISKPKRIARIGLRYINRITIPHEPVRMEDYYNIYPQLPKQTGDVHGAFMVRVELPCPQKGHAVLITFATSPPDRPGQVAHLLDLYAIFQTDALLSERELQAEIRAAHANLNAAFEGSVTDKLRAIFEPISQLC